MYCRYNHSLKESFGARLWNKILYVKFCGAFSLFQLTLNWILWYATYIMTFFSWRIRIFLLPRQLLLYPLYRLLSYIWISLQEFSPLLKFFFSRIALVVWQSKIIAGACGKAHGKNHSYDMLCEVSSVATIGSFLTLLPDDAWGDGSWMMIGQDQTCSVTSLPTKTPQTFMPLWLPYLTKWL